ncbi:hypothetical protein CI109_103462 [Kwoniella shandongensis]|uniref:Uncharacterized protein n=1 Tax=Kwoniella shandongensis TaxID=1734106 RepID=A0A5M6C1K0_9TREE|nr:uncharacterized protein CI109_004635 [Kwoniella shandongensis]KAA5527099.1 hypothetical protein CI109_004635 [Kwoniella shandongensis]
MTTPAALTFSALSATTGLLFMIWHIWHFDRFRCMLYSRDDWFRAVMCHILFWSVICFLVYTWINVHVIYSEYWVFIPQINKTIVSPWQLWSEGHQRLWRIGLYVMSAGWGFLQGVHLEEFLYWGYLIKSIRTPGGPKTSWIGSGFFKIWVALFVSAFALLLGSVHIETHNLDIMRCYLFLIGSCMSILLAVASVVLCVIFPSFLRTVKRQGATFEVLERLYFFAEINQIRTVCRIVYSICFIILSADGFTKEKKINSTAFWPDVLFLCGQFGLFSATVLSVVVLLPRNMSSESLPPSNEETFHPMVPFKRPLPEGYSAKQFYELGERLNVGHETMAAGLFSANYTNRDGEDENFEMSLTPPSSGSGKTQVEEGIPFAEVADKSKMARMSRMPALPTVVQHFTSPFQTGDTRPTGPTQVYVTSHTVVEKE